MAKKKRSSSPAKELKGLRSKLEAADARAERWKAKAGRFEKAAAESKTQVKKLTKRLEKTSAGPPMPRADAPRSVPASKAPAPRATPAPDASWTVARLRDEARSRGLTGYSGRTKAQLLEILS